MGSEYKGIPINCSKNTHEAVFELITKNRSAHIADIPCGAGAFIQRLKDSGCINVKAVDISNDLKIDHRDFFQADMNDRLPFDEDSLDALICIDGIEHIERQFDFVREAHRVIAPGGELIISTPNVSSIKSRLRWFLTGHHEKCVAPFDENKPNPFHHISMISHHELRYMLHSNGFKIAKIKTNRIKLSSLIYALFVPAALIATGLTYLTNRRHDGIYTIKKETFFTAFSMPILFGETLIVRAVKKS